MSGRTYMGIAAMAAAAMLAGCNEPMPGSTRSLGSANYAQAFAASREVLSQHFSVLPAEASSGEMKTRPQIEEAKPEGLIGFTNTSRRKIATLRLYREGNDVVAQVAVMVQQQGQSVYRDMGQPGDEYSSVPNRTPAQEEAATTPEQNDAWRTVGRDHSLERTILADIYRALHSPQGQGPTTKPAGT